MGLGAAMALPLAPGLPAGVAAAPPAALLAVGFLALGASALGFLTWAYACARIDVTAAASTLYAVPPVAALAGWALLGEVPSPLTALGGAVALGGVAVTARSRSPGPARPQAQAAARSSRSSFSSDASAGAAASPRQRGLASRSCTSRMRRSRKPASQ
jgi:drug/metabolite transporter (DMT)-like permease